MKKLLFYLLVFMITACRMSEKKSSSPLSKNIISSDTTRQKIDLHVELNRKNSSDYMISLEDSILALVAKEIYNPFFSYKLTVYKQTLGNYELQITAPDSSTIQFTNKESHVSIHYLETDEPTIELPELTDTFLLGKLTDTNLIFPSGVFIGMKKQDFLNKYFKNSAAYSNDIHTIVVWENEIAEGANAYYFRDNVLTEIVLGYEYYN